MFLFALFGPRLRGLDGSRKTGDDRTAPRRGRNAMEGGWKRLSWTARNGGAADRGRKSRQAVAGERSRRSRFQVRHATSSRRKGWLRGRKECKCFIRRAPGTGSIAVLTARDLIGVSATVWLDEHPQIGPRPDTPSAGYRRLGRSDVVEPGSCPSCEAGRYGLLCVASSQPDEPRRKSLCQPTPPSTRTGKTTSRTGWRAGCSCGRVTSAPPEALHVWNRQRKDGNPSHRLRLIPRNDWRRAMNSRTSGRKNALLKRPIGGSGSR